MKPLFAPPGFTLDAIEAARTIGANLLLANHFPIPHLFAANPVHAVNGALWSIRFEFLCYIGVALIGIVALPGLLSGECMTRENASVLSVGINADPADPRTDTINGDVMVGGQIVPSWGLHLIDMQVAMEDLVDLAKAQGQSWLRQRGK